MEHEQLDAVMTVSEVSAYLRLSESTVYRLAREGKMPAAKVGGTWRFSRKHLDIWLAGSYQGQHGRRQQQ